MNKIIECLRPREEISQDIPMILTKNKDNLNSEIDMMKIKHGIINNRKSNKNIWKLPKIQKEK